MAMLVSVRRLRSLALKSSLASSQLAPKIRALSPLKRMARLPSGRTLSPTPWKSFKRRNNKCLGKVLPKSLSRVSHQSKEWPLPPGCSSKADLLLPFLSGSSVPPSPSRPAPPSRRLEVNSKISAAARSTNRSYSPLLFATTASTFGIATHARRRASSLMPCRAKFLFLRRLGTPVTLVRRRWEVSAAAALRIPRGWPPERDLEAREARSKVAPVTLLTAEEAASWREELEVRTLPRSRASSQKALSTSTSTSRGADDPPPPSWMKPYLSMDGARDASSSMTFSKSWR
mmetsp:Transcript_17172/g.34465  ORF Transcript_17172/g.34465 Transcript_17172/m.34465 type:complete len:288 (+) Transcript_17172:639-1502(+)